MNPRTFSVALLLGLLLIPAARAERWRTYTDCRLEPAAYMDGDSFHVRHGRRTEIFRLLFVDCPETDPELVERIEEQAAYWDVAPARIPEFGVAARQFTEAFLREPFTVETQREDARGNSRKPRYYGRVRVGDEDLAYALVQAGLARIYGRMVDLPDGTTQKRYLARLRVAEREARRARRGVWAEAGRPAARLPRPAAPPLPASP